MSADYCVVVGVRCDSSVAVCMSGDHCVVVRVSADFCAVFWSNC